MNLFNNFLALLRVSRSVAEHNAVRIGSKNLLSACVCRVDRYLTTSCIQGFCNIILRAKVKQSDLLAGSAKNLLLAAGYFIHNVSGCVFL